ncbi:MAG: hypothetical protein ACI30B_01880 [Paludibacteraceae bacterium]
MKWLPFILVVFVAIFVVVFAYLTYCLVTGKFTSDDIDKMVKEEKDRKSSGSFTHIMNLVQGKSSWF